MQLDFDMSPPAILWNHICNGKLIDIASGNEFHFSTRGELHFEIFVQGTPKNNSWSWEPRGFFWRELGAKDPPCKAPIIISQISNELRCPVLNLTVKVNSSFGLCWTELVSRNQMKIVRSRWWKRQILTITLYTKFFDVPLKIMKGASNFFHTIACTTIL